MWWFWNHCPVERRVRRRQIGRFERQSQMARFVVYVGGLIDFRMKTSFFSLLKLKYFQVVQLCLQLNSCPVKQFVSTCVFPLTLHSSDSLCSQSEFTSMFLWVDNTIDSSLAAEKGLERVINRHLLSPIQIYHRPDTWSILSQTKPRTEVGLTPGVIPNTLVDFLTWSFWPLKLNM